MNWKKRYAAKTASITLAATRIPLKYKTNNNVVDALVIEALVDNKRVGHFVAAKTADGNFIADDVVVQPEYRQRGLARTMMLAAAKIVPLVPYALTDNQVYRSEEGKRLALSELRYRTAAAALLAVPELLAGAAAVGGEAAAAGGAAAAAGGAAEAAGAGAAAAGAADAGAGAAGGAARGLAKGFGKALVRHEIFKGIDKAVTPDSDNSTEEQPQSQQTQQGLQNQNPGKPAGFSVPTPQAPSLS